MSGVRAGIPSRMVRAEAATAEASAEAAPELVTEFMVDMMCEGCATSVRNKLHPLPGVTDIRTSVSDQTVRITGTESLKSLQKALEETGRANRLIGQGSLEEFEISAAVAEFKGPVVMGVLRIAQVTKDTARVEGQFDGLKPGPHAVFLNQYGDLTRGAASTGGIYIDEGREAGFLGIANADETGHAELPTAVVQLRVYDLIGRALVISESDKVSTENAFASVVARSAGVGQNLKNLCSCDGTVIWEAQQDRVS
ncbi:copper/zinc superoxide dismutase copper chaperone [Klebsormidium nitens]|uniref:Superoxide dismutase copper chaperone n=1 Tax=Klebsormidium nitens TaxID=105231 RepID=A0A1Y1IHR8_KLENI|nr:copper/zinc superoxide dismutase copper chaperone [Klebsormidium nitens]|eukprot:GAQ90354.1 copper/zinc superoxide dismutase copper chaperone [Klebsormidium nitens]